MRTCTFFGHKDSPSAIADSLEKVIIQFISEENVTNFYVGNQGHFDAIARRVLKDVKKQFPDISYAVVLAYLPGNNEYYNENYPESVYPEGLENVPKKFAISKRNEWMIKQSDFVISYVTHNTGGAAKFTETARKRGKTVFNLADM